jgi:probable HAF family extracellular repeat protein
VATVLRCKTIALALVVGCVMTVSIAVYHLHASRALYETVWLPLPLGPRPFQAYAINDRGQVLLSSISDIYVWDANLGLRHVVASNIAAPPAINNAGQVCGAIPDPNGHTQAFVWDPNLGVQKIGPSGEPNNCCSATAINNKGQVLLDSGISGELILWRHGEPLISLDLGNPQFIRASSLNDHSQAAGFVRWYEDAQRPGFYAFRCDPIHGMSTHPVGDSITGAVHVDGNGSLIWARRREGRRPPYISIWSTDDQERNVVFQGDAAHVVAVDDRGRVLVCVSRSCSGIRRYLPSSAERSYFLWDPMQGKTPIRSHARGISGDFEAVDMNNKGWILGHDYDRQGTVKLLVLKPLSGK